MQRRLEEVFADVFKFSGTLTDTHSPDSVKGWNSLGHLALVTALEEKFGITLTDDDSMDMENVGKIKEILSRRGVKA